MRIGVNSRMIRELSSCGKLRASEVDLIEISLAEIDFVVFQRWIESTSSILRENYGADFTVHAPYQNSAVDYLRINFAERKEENMKIFSKVLEVAERIEADTIVVHPGDQTSRNSFKNAVENLRTASRIASDYSINIVVENVYTSENWIKRIGETPYELRLLIEEVSMENLKVCLDIGHAHISSQMHGYTLEEFFEVLGDYVVHFHLHNNLGLSSQPWDKHLPLMKGDIDFSRLSKHLKAESAVLEIKNASKDEIVHSLAFLKGERLEVIV